MQVAEEPVFVATLIVRADSLGVACEYQTFIVEKTLAGQNPHTRLLQSP